MTRRRATILLHWTNLLLLIFLVAAGPVTGLAWVFVATAFAMCALALVKGLLNGPGPKLEGTLRRAHPFLSWGMYMGLGATGLITLLHLLGTWSASVTVSQVYFYALSASSLHAVFHLWRHTALGDGALRRITPRIMHGML